VAVRWEEASDEELRLAVVAGEPGAWTAFYRRFERLLAACARRALARHTAAHSAEDIEDILSGVCLSLVKGDFKKLRAFDAGRGYRLTSWLGLIATQTALDALRAREPAHAPLDDDRTDAAAALPDAGEEVVRREEQQALLAAIAQLAPADREFVDLVYVQEIAPEEIARRLSIAVNTVYSRKNKVREKIRALVEEAGGKVRAGSA